MDRSIAEALETLRKTLNGQIDSDTVSLISPGSVLKFLPMQDPEVADTVMVWYFEHLLRRRITGWGHEQTRAYSGSYLGMPGNIQLSIFSVMPLVVEAVNNRQADLDQDLGAGQERQIRIHKRFIAVAHEAYARHALTTWQWPDEVSDVMPKPDGEIVNGSFATNAPKVRASAWRVLRYDSSFRGVWWMSLGLVLAVMLLLAASVVLFARGHWIWGSLALAPILLLARLMPTIITNLFQIPWFIRASYASAALTPAVIVNVHPLRCLCIAGLSNGRGLSYYGVKVLRGWELPLTTPTAGKALPCVSVFDPGDHPDRWADFTPRPIEWGTGDPSELKRCLAKLDDDDRKLVTEMYNRYRRGDFNEPGVSLWVLDAQGTIVERKKQGR